jgi:hypothetical protein
MRGRVSENTHCNGPIEGDICPDFYWFGGDLTPFYAS